MTYAKGVLIVLLAVAVLAVAGAVGGAYLTSKTTCATSPFDPYAVRDGAQVVRC